MDESYKVGKNKKLFELAEFPAINTGEKVGIMFTGGIKSSLVASIAKKIYGIDNIVFLLISMDQFFNFGKDKEKLACARKNFEDGVNRLGGKHTFEFDNTCFSSYNPTSYATKKLLSKFKTIKYIFSGYSNIHEEAINMLTECGWGKGLITRGQLPVYLKNNSKKYKELSYYVEHLGCPIHFTTSFESFEITKEEYFMNVRPLRHLEFVEIVDLYNKMNLLGELQLTTSCDKQENNKHCGKCKNCLQRKYVFSQAKIIDLTNYSFNS